jgi:serine phosphatase RsbU (regulator of sigma subunit)
MMLGASTGTGFADARTPLSQDDLVILYTDGLIERRDRDLDAGFAALVEAAHDLGRLPAETVCDALLDRLLPAHGHEDDVCLLALRLTTGARTARPAESRHP